MTECCPLTLFAPPRAGKARATAGGLTGGRAPRCRAAGRASWGTRCVPRLPQRLRCQGYSVGSPPLWQLPLVCDRCNGNAGAEALLQPEVNRAHGVCRVGRLTRGRLCLLQHSTSRGFLSLPPPRFSVPIIALPHARPSLIAAAVGGGRHAGSQPGRSPAVRPRRGAGRASDSSGLDIDIGRDSAVWGRRWRRGCRAAGGWRRRRCRAAGGWRQCGAEPDQLPYSGDPAAAVQPRRTWRRKRGESSCRVPSGVREDTETAKLPPFMWV